MYSGPDPEMLPLYLFSLVTRRPSLSPFTRTGEGGLCVLRKREVDRPTMTFSTPSPSCEESGRFPPLLSSLSFDPLSLQPESRSLWSATPSLAGWTSGAERDLLESIELHSTPHPGSQMLSQAGELQFFSQPVAPSCCWWYTAWSGMFLFFLSSLFFFFFLFLFWRCRSDGFAPLRTKILFFFFLLTYKNTYTGIIVI